MERRRTGDLSTWQGGSSTRRVQVTRLQRKASTRKASVGRDPDTCYLDELQMETARTDGKSLDGSLGVDGSWLRSTNDQYCWRQH